MVTLTPEQLPVLNGLAASFAVSDAWFSALPGGTDSNRAFALTGSSFNITTTYEGGAAYADFPDTPRRQSVWHALWTQGITDWKIYWSVLWYEKVFTYHLYLEGEIPTVDDHVDDYVQPLTQFQEDCRAGTLPKFSFIEPVWIAKTGSTSYHPGSDLVPAEKALNEIYQAIATGPGWSKTALVLTFSKGGGMYDHVPPPRTVKPWPSDLNDGFAFDVLGPRVPTLVVSPYVKPNTVFRAEGSTPFSATSTVATVLDWLGVPRSRWGLGDRMAQAPTFETVFQLTKPRTDVPAFGETAEDDPSSTC
jgi:phospholipase C